MRILEKVNFVPGSVLDEYQPMQDALQRILYGNDAAMGLFMVLTKRGSVNGKERSLCEEKLNCNVFIQVLSIHI